MDEIGWQGDQVENVPPEYKYENRMLYARS